MAGLMHSRSLLDLPGEIRNTIWEYVFFCDDADLHLLGSQKLRPLLTCRQIYHEAQIVAFENTTFLVPHNDERFIFDRVCALYELNPRLVGLISSIAVRAPKHEVTAYTGSYKFSQLDHSDWWAIRDALEEHHNHHISYRFASIKDLIQIETFVLMLPQMPSKLGKRVLKDVAEEIAFDRSPVRSWIHFIVAWPHDPNDLIDVQEILNPHYMYSSHKISFVEEPEYLQWLAEDLSGNTSSSTSFVAMKSFNRPPIGPTLLGCLWTCVNALLPTLVCRQIHHETAVLAFQRTVFQMHDQFMGSLFDRVYNVPPGQSSLITSLAVNVDCQHDSPLLESPFYWFSILRHQNLALSNLLVFLIPTEQLGRGVPAMEDLINALLKNVSQAKSIEQIVIVGHSET
ncbi:hypothetical protein LTS18_009254 [Coniosporium uncinatum]|uniref:Uncharacterized protein n=1 Tax=Coniosporium uncinatum TaxID=93489 RepID=A0ACC3DDA6_9PEZI|nr:hypothetical protein LTS18_009254 [Coniosporium uncinatum]